ncbi:MAG TPA: M15 family metallopeptidase [Patescibacteria group bacterium]|nr:M15 family metallopeptidase [Patescibacteria group bacterium]
MPFPFRLNGRRYIIATAHRTTKHLRHVVADARGRRWCDVQIRRRADDSFLAIDRAFVDSRGRILAMATDLGRAAWTEVDARRIAAMHRMRVHAAPTTCRSIRPPDWDGIARSRGFERIDEPHRLDFVGFAPDGRPMFLASRAAAAWRGMRSAAFADGIALETVSTFRSIAHQHALVARKLARGNAIDQVFAVNAVPGYSEHHSGRAIDIGTPGCAALDEAFERTPAFTWLQNHAAAFGFRMSYPRDNRHGVIHEPWHWCFVA